MNYKQQHAVMAGDIVDSSGLPTDVRRRLAPLLRKVYDEVAEIFGSALPYDIAITAGDEWRIFVEQPRLSLAVSLAFCTKLKAHDLTTRAIVVVDQIDFIDQGNLLISDGPAFRRAGRGLDDYLGDEWHFALLLPEHARLCETLFAESTSELLDILLNDLTPAQARAISEKFREVAGDRRVTASDIGARWDPEPISRQAVGTHLRRGRWRSFQRTLNRFERLMEASDDQ